MTTADEFARELEAAADSIDRGNHDIITWLAGEALELTRQRAPRGKSTDYASSWKSDTELVDNGTTVHIFTEAMQAARLEYGMHGRDSLGRVYDVAPQSHQRSAIDVVYPQIKASLQAMVERALP